MKTVYLQLLGTGKQVEIEMMPGVTTEDLLNTLNLEKHFIIHFQKSEPIALRSCLYDQVDDGEKLIAVPINGDLAATPIAARAKCAQIEQQDEQAEPVYDRQAKVPGFSQQAITNLKVLLAGAGALGGEIAEGLTRKGVGELTIVDFDVVQVTNLNRQFFYEQDVYKNKALALVRNLQPHGYLGTELIGWPLSFQEAVEIEVDLSCDVVVCAVDDAEARVAISHFATERKIPAVFSAVSEQADHGVVFVQEVGKPCFGCAFPDQVRSGRTPCPGSPAIKDVMKVMAGVVLYAIDTLFMDRPRSWNFYDISLVDGNANRFGNVERRPDCPLCGGG